MGLPVAQDVKRGAGGDRRQAGLRDLQLLEVGVDRRVGPAMTCRGCCLKEERRQRGGGQIRTDEQIYTFVQDFIYDIYSGYVIYCPI